MNMTELVSLEDAAKSFHHMPGSGVAGPCSSFSFSLLEFFTWFLEWLHQFSIPPTTGGIVVSQLVMLDMF